MRLLVSAVGHVRQEAPLPKPLLVPAPFALVGALTPAGSWTARAVAHDATPSAGPGAAGTTILLVEHNDSETNVDVGDPGPSAGDLCVGAKPPL